MLVGLHLLVLYPTVSGSEATNCIRPKATEAPTEAPMNTELPEAPNAKTKNVDPKFPNDATWNTKPGKRSPERAAFGRGGSGFCEQWICGL